MKSIRMRTVGTILTEKTEMRALIQRTSGASVTVDGRLVGEIRTAGKVHRAGYSRPDIYKA
jgi:hypothetical protein